MSVLKTILKNSILLFVLITIGINFSCVSNKLQSQAIDIIKPEIGFITNNEPYDFLYTDGVYTDGNASNKFEQYYNDQIEWDNFTLDFDFFTTVKRKQWPIMMGTATRSLGFLLNQNRTIEITANNQRQNFQTQGLYETNKWYHVKIVKLNTTTIVCLNDVKIGEFQILIDDDAKNYFSNNISSVNYSNGIAFDGGLRNIIYNKKGNLEFSERIYKNYASKYSDEDLLFSKSENLFQKTNEYKLFNLNWKSFIVQFDYIHTDSNAKLIIGDKWKIIEFGTKNDTASISMNNNRNQYLSTFKLEQKHKYKIQFLINNDVLQMLIDDAIVLNTKAEYYFDKMLARENEIFVTSTKEKPSEIFKSLKVQNNVISEFSEPLGHIVKNNNPIDTINEGLLEALFIPPFELDLKGNDSDEEFAFTKSISGFNIDSFQMTFDFLTNKTNEQNLLALGVYTKFSEIDLSILDGNLQVKTNNTKSTVSPINLAKIKTKWNNCKIVYENGLLKIYLNNNKTHEIKLKFSEQFYRSKLLTIKNSFVGSLKNLYVYESVK